MNLMDALGKRFLVTDGAMGTLLQAAGLPEGYPPDLWAIEKPEIIKGVHRSYLEAGCNIITTDTFGANSLKLAPYGKTVSEVVSAAVSAAREAIAESGREDAFVALDIGPTGKLLKPMGDLEFEDAVKLFSETVKAGAQSGADAVIIETMSDTYELKAAVLAAKESCSLPILCTMVFDEKGKLLTGADITSAVALLEAMGVDALGMNCGMGPGGMLPLVKKMSEVSSLPLIVNPNAGLPKTRAGKTFFDVTPEVFSETMKPILEYASVVGGCCGTTPEHIAELVKAVQCVAPPVLSDKGRTFVTSYANAVEIGDMPVIIGERINPTGKKVFKQALRDGDKDYILREGIKQEEKGAHILDVNVGLPEIDEAAVLKDAIVSLQKVTPLPLQIDTSDVIAMENALRVYNGKPLVNSVNGKAESLATVLPLVKKYGGAVVGLTLDENGIPETAEGRLKIAEKIVEAAEKIGIKRKDILIDALTLPVSADAEAAKVTLEAMALIKSELGVKTVLGVSNVSFGLPERGIVNSGFYTLAMEHGLNAGIINPCSEAMMSAYDAFCALKGFDGNCENYISRHSGEEKTVPEDNQADISLYDAVIKGFSEKAASVAAVAAQSRDVLEIINSELVPALDKVGNGFETGKVFLPQLLMSAEAAKAAFDALKPYLKSDLSESGGDVIVLATVKGDIHDIGKNIVKVLLENYRFKVVDLGKDVPPEAVVEAVKRENARVVGLSALMTTTVPAMEKTIKLLRKECKDVKIIVGGAVMTEEYAAVIDADFYGKDAMEDVRFAQNYLNN